VRPAYRVKHLFYGMKEGEYNLNIIELYSEEHKIDEAHPHSVPQTSVKYSSDSEALKIIKRVPDLSQNLLFCVKIAPNEKELQKALHESDDCKIENEDLSNYELVEIGLIVDGNTLIYGAQKQSAYGTYEENGVTQHHKNFKIDVLLENISIYNLSADHLERIFSMLLIKH
jgi:hypothetical protein